MLRDYQQDALGATTEHLSKSKESCVIEAATGAGKSHIIAALAEWWQTKSDKPVLCLAPSAELVKQNHSKYIDTGAKASFFSASVGIRCLRQPVVFGTPMTVYNKIDRVAAQRIGMVVIDEAHNITPTIKEIIGKLRKINENLRVVGLTATPYRTNEGYIYKVNIDGKIEPLAIDPYFTKLVYRITTDELLDRGFLTPPTTDIGECYATENLKKNSSGKFTSESVASVYESERRKTARIIESVIEKSANRKAVMVFAASIEHAREVMKSLPTDQSLLITGGMPKRERNEALAGFKQGKYKYIVNRDVLTTGFDAPHVDVVAVLRRTESPGLFQQIIGRGMRLHEDKQDFLLLDFAKNIENHCPDGDLFSPELVVRDTKKDGVPITVTCPDCSGENEFKARENPDGFGYSADGYFLDLTGAKLDMPSHHGRRCQSTTLFRGLFEQCNYRWTSKECPSCLHLNDIAARYCEKCKHEIIDPNEKLEIEYQKIKRSAQIPTADKVISWFCRDRTSKAGNDMLQITWKTECRTFDAYYMSKHKSDWLKLNQAVFGDVVVSTPIEFVRYLDHGKMPRTITASKPKGNNFFRVHKYNEEIQCQD